MAKTDWIGVCCGIGAGLVGTGYLYLFPSDTAGWFLIAVGSAIIVGSLLRKFLQPLASLGFGSLSLIILMGIWTEFRVSIIGHRPVPLGPRFEFQGIKAERKGDNYELTMHLVNTSEVEATSHVVAFSLFKNDGTDVEIRNNIEDAFNKTREELLKQKLLPLENFEFTRGMGLDVIMGYASDKDFGDLKNGVLKEYIIIIMEYSNYAKPVNRVWVTEMCARITSPFTGFQACPIHNRYYFADNILNVID